jgi:anti-sigma regulatory factor (Ser/Thr protein kinase)
VEISVPNGGLLVIASDGVAEAHGADGSMYGFQRVADVVQGAKDPAGAVVDDVDDFAVGAQEDDITIVVLRRRISAKDSASSFGSTLLEFQLPSVDGIERDAMDRVMDAATGAGMELSRAKKLGTAVAEAVMNAAEHGNGFDPERPVDVVVSDDGSVVEVNVTDNGPGAGENIDTPDIDAKIAGDQGPRGWGRFLIEKLVDELEDQVVDGRHTLTMRMRKEDS